MRHTSNRFSTKTIVYCALFAALAVVLGRITAVQIPPDAKYCLDKFIMFMSGMFFGPVLGAMVGFVADCVGSLSLGYGFTWYLSLPAILYGLFGGLFQNFLKKEFSLIRLGIAYLFPIVIGSIVWQSFAFSYMKGINTFSQIAIVYLIPRTIQFAIMLVLEVALIYTLIKTNLFCRVGLWPRQNRKKEVDKNDC